MKSSYKIPVSINKSYGDQEINLNSFTKTPHMVKAKVILFYLVSFTLLFVLMVNSPLKNADLWIQILVIICWSFLTILLNKTDKTGQPNYSLLRPMMNYFGQRTILTRNFNDSSEFAELTGIKKVVPEKGYISFSDGTCGFVYRIVGNATMLGFDSDIKRIIDSYEAFLRRIEPNTELIYITLKEKQNVKPQIEHLETLKKRMIENGEDPDLIHLCNVQMEYMEKSVGNQAIHQYLVIKSANSETLTKAATILISEAEQGVSFRSCTPVVNDELIRVLGLPYR